ncbi:Leucine-rich repeat-containing protein 37A [Manis javanica]|nr:Leucine-rich repeat-containing protein 37A [Manis javanica]
MGCSETHLKPACAKLIFQTGLLMKLLSEQQEAKEPRADWDTDQRETENYIHESPEAQSEQEEQEFREFPKVLVHGYRIKVILALSVTGAVLVLITAFCLIKKSLESLKANSSSCFSMNPCLNTPVLLVLVLL